MSELVKPLTAAELLKDTPIRELIMVAGKDGVGKSSAVVSMAAWIEQIQPQSTFYVIDTENKFRSAMKSFGVDAPHNIQYFKVDNMNEATAALAEVMAKHKPGDWLAVESMARLWERAQDLAYLSTSGITKAEYLERRRGSKGTSPIPQPDQFWSIAKGAHDGAFVDLLTSSEDLNVLLTTTVSKPRDQGFIKENADRKATRIELGIDSGFDGAPRLVYYIETLALIELRNGVFTCRMLRDNLTQKEDGRVEFPISGRKTWGPEFWDCCRNGA